MSDLYIDLVTSTPITGEDSDQNYLLRLADSEDVSHIHLGSRDSALQFIQEIQGDLNTLKDYCHISGSLAYYDRIIILGAEAKVFFCNSNGVVLDWANLVELDIKI